MIQFILMLFGLAFGNHNANTSCNNNGGTTTIQTANNPGTELTPDPGTGSSEDGDPVRGNSGQLPPPPRP
ncbi:hypothetical protein [Chryseobacterium camelliae]|uniref:hypothetical protein n=1 Tax=Chryseobacterium camelliae TaxID=1265445 RepID=UPI0025FA0A15|nr:hypothetical protein [Chryseobacterium camelliae]MDR6514857.1 hypothetical protein [Chryseobacterium camelliae]